MMGVGPSRSKDASLLAWSRSEIDRRCECGWLDNAVAEPGVPIEFDETVGEFQLVYQSPNGLPSGRMTFYYCPFCGCQAPESKRHTLFTVLTQSEISRIEHLCRDLRSLDDVRARFGKPDEEMSNGVGIQEPEEPGVPPTATQLHTLKYCGLSALADVLFFETKRDSLQMTMHGKYIGPKS
jgi:hypothetical protein